MKTTKTEQELTVLLGECLGSRRAGNLLGGSALTLPAATPRQGVVDTKPWLRANHALPPCEPSGGFAWRQGMILRTAGRRPNANQERKRLRERAKNG